MQLPNQVRLDLDVDQAYAAPPLPDDSQAERAAALAEIMRAITASLDVTTSFGVIAQQAQHILTHDVLAILLPSTVDDTEFDNGKDGAWLVACCYPPAVQPGLALPLADCSFSAGLLNDRPVVIEDFAAQAAEYSGDRLLLDSLGHAAVIVPIQATPRVLGGLALVSRTPSLYREQDVGLVESLAGLLALALEHQRLDRHARALAVAEERNRLAREIHDTLAHSLTSIIINLESFKPYAEGRSQSDAELLAETEGLARGALAEARRSVLGLQPAPLQHRSLRNAMALELAGLGKQAELVTQFYVHGTERSLAPDAATALYRVAQEAFHNIEKHAAARHVIVGLAFEDEQVVLTIEDDGIGFLPADTAPTAGSGFGLLSMAARVHSLGGDLQVTGLPGHGSTVRATVPYVCPSTAPTAVVLKANGTAEPAPVAHPTRVLIVDNHTTTRQGVRRILEGRPDMEVVGEASDGLIGIELTGRLHPDVVLLDLQMPRLSGVEALPRLRAVHPAVEVVVLTMFDQDEQLFASLKAGARGFVVKDAAPETIVAAVRAASQGQSALPPALATRVMDRFSVLAQRDVDPDALTEHELTVLQYMAQGLPYKKIARQLNVTTHTVQYHASNILQKLHAGNRGEAVAIALQRGLLKQVK